MFKDFRDFLSYLEENGKLLRVDKEVDTAFEIAAGIRKISDTDGPALLFENIKGFPGWRVAGGVYATQKLFALALGLPVESDEPTILKRYLECYDKQLKPELVATGPVHEVVIKGEDIDLMKLPVAIHSGLDCGRYLTAGVEIGKHPDTGVQNVSIHRRLILDRNRTAILARGYQQLARLIAAAEKRGEGLGIATAIGVDPALVIASQVVAPLGVDEAGIAGAFRSAPLQFVKCKTIDVEVPANAEVVIEGVIVPGEKTPDGPYGEFPGNYITYLRSPQIEAPVVKVTAITMRKNPIFQTMLTGVPMTENHILRKWAVLAAAHEEASKFAKVKAITGPPGDDCQLHLIISIIKKHDEEPGKIMHALFSRLGSTKHIMVVDDDINIYNPVEVEWALVTRVMADKDIIIIPPGEPPRAAKWGIDATMPLKDRKWYRRIVVPGVDKVDYV